MSSLKQHGRRPAPTLKQRRVPSFVHTPSRSDVSGKQRSASARPDVTSNQAAAGQQSGQPGTQSLMKSGRAGRDGEDVEIMGTEDFAFNTRLGDSWQRPGAFMDLQLSLRHVVSPNVCNFHFLLSSTWECPARDDGQAAVAR